MNMTKEQKQFLNIMKSLGYEYDESLDALEMKIGDKKYNITAEDINTHAPNNASTTVAYYDNLKSNSKFSVYKYVTKLYFGSYLSNHENYETKCIEGVAR